MQFRQEASASEYVILNNNRRKEATAKKDEFGKDFFELMNNSCYGQMMMNEREFKHGEFFSGTKKIRGQEVSKRKLAISDLDNKNTFVIRDQMNTITKPIACGVSILGISKAYMVSMWYKLMDKFGAYNIFLIFIDTDSLVFGLKGNTYKEAYIFSYIREEPEFAQLFDLDGVPEVDKLIPGNPYWSLKNKKVMGKFKFEVLGIGEIGANAPKSNSILVVDEEDNTGGALKTKLTLKGIDTCCIADTPKRSKKLEEMEGEVLLMEKDKTLVRHNDMIDCVTKGIEGPEVYDWRIESIKQSGTDAHKMMTRKHKKKTFSLYDDKRYLIEDYHSLAYGHKDAKELIPIDEVRKT